MNELRGYRLLATDGKIGSVEDFLFDDQNWTNRYLVADTGHWLPGKLVLISPVSLAKPDWREGVFPVRLTREQIQNSPGIDTHKPVSRQHETELHRYYGWPAYWAAYAGPESEMETAEVAAASYEARRQAAVRTSEGDPHLRSIREVTGYSIHASDGEIGHVEDFIVDADNWVIRYMVVDTRKWLSGKEVLVAPRWIREVRWDERSVHVDLSKEQIKHGPPFDPTQPVNREYEVQLYDYYGRPKYW
jgi:sporulation protein YlmC with PRC-barrel domain